MGVNVLLFPSVLVLVLVLVLVFVLVLVLLLLLNIIFPLISACWAMVGGIA